MKTTAQFASVVCAALFAMLPTAFTAAFVVSVAFFVPAAPDVAGAPAPKPPAAEVANTWFASPSRYNGKAVATHILEIEPAGTFPADAPCAVVRCVTGNAAGREGGDILVLVPPAKARVFADIHAPSAAGTGKRTLFGSQVKTDYKRLDATARLVAGEIVLLWGGVAPPAAGAEAPALTLMRQLREAGLPATRYRQREFRASLAGRSGRIETQAVLDRFLRQRNAKAAAEKQLSWNRDDLRRELRKGARFDFDDPVARASWRIAW